MYRMMLYLVLLPGDLLVFSQSVLFLLFLFYLFFKSGAWVLWSCLAYFCICRGMSLDSPFGYAWMLFSWAPGCILQTFFALSLCFWLTCFCLICDGSSDMFGVLDDLLPWGMGSCEGVCRIHLGLFSVSNSLFIVLWHPYV